MGEAGDDHYLIDGHQAVSFILKTRLAITIFIWSILNVNQLKKVTQYTNFMLTRR